MNLTKFAFFLLVSPITNAFILSTVERRSSDFSLKVASKPVDEALAIYQKRFPNKGENKKLFFTSWGVPKRDIDGSLVNKSNPRSTSKRLFDIDDKQQRAAFQELARVYGEDTALQMTRDLPSILAFNKKS